MVKYIIDDPKTNMTKSILKTEFFDIEEEWKPFIYAGIDSGWKISSFGRVKNRSGNLVKLHYDKDGYTRFCFYIPKNDEIYCNYKPIESIVKTHRAVASAFIENDEPETKVLVMHKNDIRDCNFALNLKWGTYQENMDDKKESNRAVYARGEEKPEAKWKEKDIHFICNCFEKGLSIDDILQSSGYINKPDEELKSYKILINNLKKRHIWKRITDQYRY